MPTLLAGPRNPVTSASLYYVGPNANAHGRGVEAEVSIGSTLPVLAFSAADRQSPVILGIEAAAFARFGLQVLERELIASDWLFAVPLVWHRSGGWIRFRYFHTSSHMGDEYARRFENTGIDYSRDAVELLSFHALSDRVGVYGGVRFSYNVHPEDSKRWIVRAGGQIEAREEGEWLLPFGAADLEWDQAARGTRVELRGGAWLPPLGNRRAISLAFVVLTGPSPLGQFSGLTATQVGLTVSGAL